MPLGPSYRDVGVQPLAFFYDLRDGSEDVVECFYDGPRTNILHEYIEGKLRIEVQVWVRRIKDKESHWLACYEKGPAEIGNRVAIEQSMRSSIIREEVQEQMAVLVDAVKVMKQPQVVAERIVPSVIRLYRLNVIESLTTDLAVEVQRQHVASAIAGDVEMDVKGVARGVRPVWYGSNQLPRDVFKSRAEIVKNVTNGGTPLKIDHGGTVEAVDVLASSFLYVAAHSLLFMFKSRRECVCEGVEVRLRTIHLDPRGKEVLGHDLPLEGDEQGTDTADPRGDRA
jgi:hypothetical protein